MCTWSDMYNFLEDFLWAAAPSQSQFWSYVKSLVWHPMSCCDTEMKPIICLCFFTRNTVILPHDLHSFNLTSFEAKTVEILHLLHNFEAKTVVLPRCLQSFKAKIVVSPHFFLFHTVWSQNCDMSSFLAYLWSHKLILSHALHSLKPETAIWPHVLNSFRAKSVILPPIFHS